MDQDQQIARYREALEKITGAYEWEAKLMQQIAREALRESPPSVPAVGVEAERVGEGKSHAEVGEIRSEGVDEKQAWTEDGEKVKIMADHENMIEVKLPNGNFGFRYQHELYAESPPAEKPPRRKDT